MALTLLQFDFPAEGPWGADMAEAYAGLAQQAVNEPLSQITRAPLASGAR